MTFSRVLPCLLATLPAAVHARSVVRQEHNSGAWDGTYHHFTISAPPLFDNPAGQLPGGRISLNKTEQPAVFTIDNQNRLLDAAGLVCLLIGKVDRP